MHMEQLAQCLACRTFGNCSLLVGGVRTIIFIIKNSFMFEEVAAQQCKGHIEGT